MQQDHVSSNTGTSILVVIPTLNEAATITNLLEQLTLEVPESFQVLYVVADGGSVDGTQKLVKCVCASRSDVVLLHNPKRLQSAGVNLAVQTYGTQMKYLVRCDAHASYPAGFVRRLVETSEWIGSDSVVIPMDSVGKVGVQRAVAILSDIPLGTGGSAHRGGRWSGYVDHGHHALIRISSFKRAGGYDESFSHNEDAEFDCRLQAVGGTIYLDADIRIAYSPRATLRKLWQQYFAYGKGRSRTVRRHPSSLRLRQFAVPTFIGSCALSLPLSLLWLPLGAPAFTYAAVLLAVSTWFAIWLKGVDGLLVGPAALTMHTAWAAGFATGLITVRTERWILPYEPNERRAYLSESGDAHQSEWSFDEAGDRNSFGSDAGRPPTDALDKQMASWTS